MRLLFYFSWVLLLAAFLVCATDPFLTTLGRNRLWTSAYDLWYAISPRTLILSQISIEKVSIFLWQSMIVPILQVPGWFLLGAPGAVLAWTCRPNKIMSPEVREEYERRKKSLFIFDELSQAAKRDESYNPKEDDQAPVHQLFENDELMRTALNGENETRDVPANYPSEKYLEDWDLEMNANYAVESIKTPEVLVDPDTLPYDSISSNLNVGALPPPGTIKTTKRGVDDKDR